MPKFLTKNELYRLIQRELPEDVYPDGDEDAYYSTADNASIADGIAKAYANLERIYDNYFPLSAVERISDWEIAVFGVPQDASQTLQQRRNNVVAQLRKRRSISLWDILTAVVLYVPEGTYVQIVEWGCSEGGWVLDVSELDYSTILNGGLVQKITSADACEINPADFGVSPEEWALIQNDAYSYDVRIFGITLSDEATTMLEMLLNRIEPARSKHFIYQNQDLADYGLNTVVTDVGQFSLVSCIKVDATSQTGYSGRI